MDIIQSYANSRAGDRAGFFVVKERVVPGRESRSRPREMYPISKGAVGGSCFHAALHRGFAVFYLFRSVIFGGVAGFTRLFCSFPIRPPPFTGIYNVGCTPSLRHDN